MRVPVYWLALVVQLVIFLIGWRRGNRALRERDEGLFRESQLIVLISMAFGLIWLHMAGVR